MSAPSNAAWTQAPERSNLAVLRLMVMLSLTFGRRFCRLLLHPIAAYFVLFSPKARAASRLYLSRALGRKPSLADIYRHFFAFASTIHDRLYLLNGRFDDFQIEMEGADTVDALAEQGQGLLLIGAHLGSFEVMRVLGRQRAGFNVSMLMYEQNARKINEVLAAINPSAVQDIVPLGQMDSMMIAQSRVEQGHLVGMLADRGLGGDAVREIEFLGQPAPFPLGPWRMAVMLRRPVFLMLGLYLGGNRYKVVFEPIADFTHVERSTRQAAMNAAQEKYAERLAYHCRQAPYNWFNFFDFWQR
jgi:predicted LPLAT superfamily acyltransferase